MIRTANRANLGRKNLHGTPKRFAVVPVMESAVLFVEGMDNPFPPRFPFADNENTERVNTTGSQNGVRFAPEIGNSDLVLHGDASLTPLPAIVNTYFRHAKAPTL